MGVRPPNDLDSDGAVGLKAVTEAGTALCNWARSLRVADALATWAGIGIGAGLAEGRRAAEPSCCVADCSLSAVHVDNKLDWRFT